MFKPATKEKQKLRLAISGPPGTGKTFSALRIATGMGGKIALADSEHESASLYADKFKFYTASIDAPHAISSYIDAIRDAEKAGYSVLIIDSLSHAWEFVLGEVEKLAKAKYSGNTYRAWAEGNALQGELFEAILASKLHVICTMRSKMEYSMEDGANGKKTVKKLGMAPVQRNGAEYEFTMQMEGMPGPTHIFTMTKDRTGKFQDKEIESPGEAFGKELIDWLNDGIDPEERMEQEAVPLRKDILAEYKKLEAPSDDLKIFIDNLNAERNGQLLKAALVKVRALIKRQEDNKPI